jgi:hypothetical protein
METKMAEGLVVKCTVLDLDSAYSKFQAFTTAISVFTSPRVQSAYELSAYSSSIFNHQHNSSLQLPNNSIYSVVSP